MLTWTFFAFSFLAGSGDWDRQKAFDFLEARGQKWAEWKPAQKEGGACVSCHTGMSYLLARRVLAESSPRPVEKALVDGVTHRVTANPPKTMLNVDGPEAIFNLLTLALQRRDAKEPVKPADRLALDRLWQAQQPDGTWNWFMHDLHPVESEHSVFYGVVLAEYALRAYADPGPADRLASARAYLTREAPKQPLHNKLAWIALGSGQSAKDAVLKDLWKAQAQDGGWTNDALGPWAKHEDAPPSPGSNAYATAWAAYTARQAGVACNDKNLKRAFSWLIDHQDRATGAWQAVSMNKVFPAGSMQSGFMSDMATGFAAAALASCGSH